MSWNARRLAYVSQMSSVAVGDDAVYIWLTREAIERVKSALKNTAIEFTAEPLPLDRIGVVGLAEPLDTPEGEASIIVHRADIALHVAADSAARLCKGRADREKLEPATAAEIASRTLALATYTRGGAMCGVGAAAIVHIEGSHLDLQHGYERGCDMSAEDAEVLLRPVHSADTVDELGGILLAAWTLYVEPVERDITATVTTTATVETTKSKRKAKRGNTFDVSVVSIRQPQGERRAPSGRVVEHDYRWTVRGHWRRQACGKGLTQRRKVWIEEQVRGPADKPLLIRPRVYVADGSAV